MRTVIECKEPNLSNSKYQYLEADKTRDWKTRGLQNVKPSKPKTRVLKNTLKSNTEC